MHHNARLSPVDTSKPRAFCVDDLTIGKILHFFAEVPDVAEVILREVVNGIFMNDSIDKALVVDDDAGHAFDHARFSGDLKPHYF